MPFHFLVCGQNKKVPLLFKTHTFFQLCEAVGSPIGPCISRHFNNKKAGCLDATIRSGMEVTVFRFWVFDGRYRLIALEGTILFM